MYMYDRGSALQAEACAAGDPDILVTVMTAMGTSAIQPTRATGAWAAE